MTEPFLTFRTPPGFLAAEYARLSRDKDVVTITVWNRPSGIWSRRIDLALDHHGLKAGATDGVAVAYDPLGGATVSYEGQTLLITADQQNRLYKLPRRRS